MFTKLIIPKCDVPIYRQASLALFLDGHKKLHLTKVNLSQCFNDYHGI